MKRNLYHTALATAILLAIFQLAGFAQTNQGLLRMHIVQNVHFSLDLGYPTGDLSKVEINGRNASGKESRWFLEELSDGTFKLIPSTAWGFALEASTTNRGVVALATSRSGLVPNAANRNQRWRKVDERNGTFKLQNMYYTDMVLDASAGTRGKVQLWANLGASNDYVPNAANQRWRSLPITRPQVVADIIWADTPIPTMATLMVDLYNSKNTAEMLALTEYLPSTQFRQVLEASGLSSRIAAGSSSYLGVNHAIKRAAKGHRQMRFTAFNKAELNLFFSPAIINRYFDRAYSPRERGLNAQERLKRRVDLLTEEDLNDLVQVYFSAAFHDAEEQTLLRVMRCLSCDQVNRLVSRFTYREFNYKFDGSENTQFKALYTNCNR